MERLESYNDSVVNRDDPYNIQYPFNTHLSVKQINPTKITLPNEPEKEISDETRKEFMKLLE